MGFAPTAHFNKDPGLAADIWHRRGKMRDGDGNIPNATDPIASLTDSFDGGVYTQPEMVQRPTLHSSLTGGVYDRVNDYLARTTAFLSGESGEVHILFETGDSVAGQQVMFAVGSTSDASTRLWLLHNGGKLDMRHQNGSGDTLDSVAGSTTLATKTLYVASFVCDGATYRILLNKAEETLTVGSGTNSGDWFAGLSSRDHNVLGARSGSSQTVFFGGRLIRMIIRDGVVSSDEQIQQDAEQLMFDGGISGGVNHFALDNRTWPSRTAARRPSFSMSRDASMFPVFQ